MRRFLTQLISPKVNNIEKRLLQLIHYDIISLTRSFKKSVFVLLLIRTNKNHYALLMMDIFEVEEQSVS